MNSNARRNHGITGIRECVLIDEDGSNLGTFGIEDAISKATEDGTDIVEMSQGDMQKPSVCRLMDYGKYLYRQEKKEKASRRSQSKSADVKQVKLRINIGAGDLDHKVADIVRFLDSGRKVIVTVMLKGREMTHGELGVALLSNVTDMVGEHGVASQPTRNGRDITLSLSPRKTLK